METLSVETIDIPTKEEIEIRIKALCLKFLLCPEKFTLFEMVELQEHMKKEGLLD